MKPSRAPADPATSALGSYLCAPELSLPRANGYLLWGVVGLSLALLIWACVSRVDIVATAPGKVIPYGKVKQIQATETAVVKAIHVREGSRVQAGDLLIELDPTLTASDREAVQARLTLALMELARLEAEFEHRTPRYPQRDGSEAARRLQEQLRLARRGAFEAQLAQARTEIRNARSSYAAAAEMSTKLAETVHNARDREARLRPLAGEVVSRFTYLDAKQALLQQEGDLAGQQAQAQNSRNEIGSLEQRLHSLVEEQQSRLAAEIADKRRELSGLTADAQKIERALNLKELRAPIDGQVNSLSVTTLGGVVTPAQSLAVIVPNDAPLVVEANLSNADAGFVEIGQAASIKVDAYPFMRYGALSGKVSWISPDSGTGDTGSPAHSGTAGARPAESSPSYRILVEVDPASNALARRLIRPGMTVQADVKTDRRRVIDFFLSPVLRYWTETVSLR